MPRRYYVSMPTLYDEMMHGGFTLAAMLVGVMYFNQTMPIDILVPAIFITSLCVYLFNYKSAEIKSIKFEKEWVSQQAISDKLKNTYLKRLDKSSTSVFWLIIRFCLLCVSFGVIAALLKGFFEGRDR